MRSLINLFRTALAASAVGVVIGAGVAVPANAEEPPLVFDTERPKYTLVAMYDAATGANNIVLGVTDDIELDSVRLTATGATSIDTTLSPGAVLGYNEVDGAYFRANIVSFSNTRITIVAIDTFGKFVKVTIEVPKKPKQFSVSG